MATYILLMTLTPEGRTHAMLEPDYLLDAENQIQIPGVRTMGLYAVLGPYDFVTIIEAPDNQAIARFSVELGVKAGVHIMTLPTVHASRLDSGPDPKAAHAEIEGATASRTRAVEGLQESGRSSNGGPAGATNKESHP